MLGVSIKVSRHIKRGETCENKNKLRNMRSFTWVRNCRVNFWVVDL